MFLQEIKSGLYLIDLDLNAGGFSKFISSWIYRRHGVTVVVDSGPQSTAAVLKKALKTLGVSKIDYLLLTHIHIDHAGGVGDLLRIFPETKVVCHPMAVKHLIDPHKLWQGTLNVLGETAKQYYGGIKAVPKHTVLLQEDINDGDLHIKIVQTPGHAAHHLCFQIDNLLFAGEALGVYLTNIPVLYHRPATPPVFKYEIFAQSVNKMAQLQGVKTVCFGHYGALDTPLWEICDKVMEQLALWIEIIRDNLDKSLRDIRDEIIKKDKVLRPLGSLADDIYGRELSFILNSIKGMHQALLSSTSIELP